MFEWISEVIANAAYDAAINSVGVASANGLYQMEEPAGLQELAKETK